MREWMYLRIIDGFLNDQFVAGVEQFIEFCKSMPRFNPQEVRCPCRKCKNRKLIPVEDVRYHLVLKGFVPHYYHWSSHGETDEMFAALLAESRQNEDDSSTNTTPVPIYENQVEQMVYDGFNVRPHHTDPVQNEEVRTEREQYYPEAPNPDAQRMYDMLAAANRQLWPGCDVTQLEAATELLSLKSKLRLTERGYDMISDFCGRVSHPETTLPATFYDTKKLVEGLGLPYEAIDCCPNSCMIYWGADEEYASCKICDHPRWKQGKTKLISYSRMFYLPITQRLQRLYASVVTAEHMRWHAEHVQEDGVMRHPSDAEAWKHFNAVWPDFAAESRNVRLGLCTDGFNPFGSSGRQYSSWHVILTPYNLPPSMCMRDEVMFLTVIMSGPKSPKQKLDVFLQPLIAELKSLWLNGAYTYDAWRKQNFVMRAAVLWTISDFPAYSMLSGMF